MTSEKLNIISNKKLYIVINKAINTNKKSNIIVNKIS